MMLFVAKLLPRDTRLLRLITKFIYNIGIKVDENSEKKNLVASGYRRP